MSERLKTETDKYKKIIANLEKVLHERDLLISSFLNKDQMKSLKYEKMKHWAPETIIKALKFRFRLGM